LPKGCRFVLLVVTYSPHEMKGAVAFVACATADAAVLRGQKVQAHMQPELVAKSFKTVEDNWRSEALSFAECTASSDAGDCTGSSQRFVESCTTLVGAVVKASSGDRSVVQEYLGDICAQPVLDDWHRSSCGEFSTALISALGVDSFSNREDLNSQAMCTKLWSKFSTEQRALFEKEQAERQEEEKAAELRAKQEAEEQRKAAEATAAEEAKAKAEEEAAQKKAAQEAAEKEAADKAAEEKATEEKAALEKANETQAQNASTVVSAADSSNSTTAVNATVESHNSVVANATVATVAKTAVTNGTDVAAMADQIAADAVANSTVAVASNATLNQSNAIVVDAPVDAAVTLALNASNASVAATVETNSTKA